MESKKLKISSLVFCLVFSLLGGLSTMLFLSSNYRHPDPESFLTINFLKDSSGTKAVEVNPDTLSAAVLPRVVHVIIPPEEQLFHLNPIFLVWSMLILIMMCISFGSFTFYTSEIWQLKKKFSLSTWQIGKSLLAAVAFLAVMILIQLSSRGYHNPGKVIGEFQILFKHWYVPLTIVVATLLLQLPIIASIFTIIPAAGRVESTKDKESIENEIEEYESLNDTLRNALQVLAIIVVFSVLTSTTLRESIKAALKVTSFDVFPSEVSYVYGLFFTLFLGIIYIPVNLLLVKKRTQLIKSVNTSKEDPEWKKEVTDGFQSEASVMENLKIALTVMSPLITSILPDQLNLFK